MKKIYFMLAILSVSSLSFAGGILTNSNQSAQFIRLMSRNAFIDVDGVYYNPAGLAFLNDGWHFSLSNQSIFQKREITSNFPTLNSNTYNGDATIPFFPNAYAVYKKGKLALSLGFGPNAGGGKLSYDSGLPSFEYQISTLPGVIQASTGLPTNRYHADLAFEGSSVFFGTQFNASYALTENLSVSAGGRLIMATNKYEGTIKNIMVDSQSPLNTSGNLVVATKYFADLAKTQTGAAQAGMLYLSEQTKDKEVDAVQTGTAFTPIIGVHYKLNKFNFAVRYEFKTNLDLENDTEKDDVGMFEDGAKFNNDIPAILAVGINYDILDNLRISGSWNHYFDKDANWEGKEKFISDNLYELSLGLEHDLNEKISLSCGYLRAQTGAAEGYQTDIAFSISSNTVGFGGKFKVNDKLELNAGVAFSSYVKGVSNKVYEQKQGDVVVNTIPYKETYDRSNSNFSIGVTYSL